MKRLYSALGLCLALLVAEAVLFLPASNAKEDIVDQLLQVPAPPPPNPLAHRNAKRRRNPDFFSKADVPKDDVPIDELIDYWSENQRAVRNLNFAPEMSEKTLERLLQEIDKDPAKLTRLIGALPDNERAANFVKGIYDREGTTGVLDKDVRSAIKRWLTYHSPYFSNDLYRLAERTGDTGSYVTGQDELLALAHVDFDKARPLIDSLYANGIDKASRVLARWALYRHALDTNSLSDIERYRDELKGIVENKNLPGPTRDLAMDALVTEKEWAGRDDWYMSLLSDETLADLQGYTGLTTLISASPPEKYVDRMLALLKSDSKVVRSAAVRNLVLQIGSKRPDVTAAMLPWLEDPNWANDIADARSNIVLALRSVKLPESVPGLIKMLDEKKKEMIYAGDSAANAMANAPAANVSVVRSFAANSNKGGGAPGMREIERYAYRFSAVLALGNQGNAAAVPALRRILPEMEGYERSGVIDAILKCRGFSIPEQVAALESAAKRQRENSNYGSAANAANAAVYAAASAANAMAAAMPAYPAGRPIRGIPDPGTLRRQMKPDSPDIAGMLGDVLIRSYEVSDELVTAVATRVEVLDQSDKALAGVLRKIMLRWPNPSVNMLFLRDVRNNKSDLESVMRLLSQRKLLRQNMSSEVSDAGTGGPTAAAITACLMENAAEYDAIIAGENIETKAALLACARLIRAPLSVAKVAEFVKSGDRRLALAAERYLEAEDSPAARAVVLSLHPGEAKILGATTAFFPNGTTSELTPIHISLFASVEPDAADTPVVHFEVGNIGYRPEAQYEGSPEQAVGDAQVDWQKAETTLQTEVKKDDSLLGVYAYDGNYVRIYKDRAVFSWDDDESRYRERPLSSNEFDALKSYLSDNRVDELAPFLQCEAEYCASKELLMLGRNGGRRVYLNGDPAEFFVGLEKFFAELKRGPSTLKYALSREIKGLEILLADDDLHAETVWKNGDDIRVAISNKAVRKKVKEEIEAAVETETEKEDPAPGDGENAEPEVLRERMRAKREFEGYSWRKVVGGSDAGPAAQPPQVELIPPRDGFAVQPTQEQWKARAANFEIRASDDGLFKVSNGRLTKLHPGRSDSPVITQDGKWVIAYHSESGEDQSGGLVRINLTTNRIFPVKTNDYSTFFPYAYVPTVNKVLIVLQNNEYDGEGDPQDAESDDTIGIDPDSSEMLLLDAETGALQPASGEFRPLAQQTFRRLQPTGKPNEFWAAIADKGKNETQVGVYETYHFGFKPLIRIPKIAFNSMSMWVDEPGNKVYFVYRGHLLSLPLKTSGN